MARDRGRIALALLLGGLVTLGTSGPAAAGGPRTRWVDDDGHAGSRGCDAARSTFRTIQRAIDVSGPGDTVVVCPGTYRQDVTVEGAGRDGLTLRAAVRGKAILRPSATSGNVPHLKVFDADGVRIQGLTLQAPTAAPCRRPLALIWVSESSGVQITRVRFAALGGNTIGPCGYETGLDVVGGAEVVADELHIRDFRKFGVLLQDPTSRVVVTDSSIRYLHAAEAPDPIGADAVGLYALHGGAVAFRRNTVRSATTGGISTPLLGAGIDVYDTPDPVVARNEVSHVTWAIAVGVGIGRIWGNAVHHGRPSGADEDVGFMIGGGEGGEISENSARGYAKGIVVDGGATDHAIHDNDFRGNSELDCYDETTGGGGTSGTSNFWTSNLGNTDDPDGLCSPS